MASRTAFYDVVIGFGDRLLRSLTQSVGCTAVHSAEAQCARWLLVTHDRANAAEFPLTHGYLATLLGVRRPTVTLILNALQASGAIRYRPGAVTICDAAQLETHACECYRIADVNLRCLPRHFGRVADFGRNTRNRDGDR